MASVHPNLIPSNRADAYSMFKTAVHDKADPASFLAGASWAATVMYNKLILPVRGLAERDDTGKILLKLMNEFYDLVSADLTRDERKVINE